MSAGRGRASPPAWLSVHLRFDGELYGADGDALIRHGVGRFVRAARSTGALRRFFFIRYGDEGPHVRLRLLPRHAEGRRTLRTAVLRANFQRLGATRGLRWITYEPEFDRYGGPSAIPVAERLFHASSRFTLDQLHDGMAEDRSARMGVAALAMLVQLRAFHDSRESACEAARRYRRGYLDALARQQANAQAMEQAIDMRVRRQLDALRERFHGVWDLLGTPDALPDSVLRFQKALVRERRRLTRLSEQGRVAVNGRPCEEWSQCADALLPSFMHMTNNRLGVAIPEEVLLATAIGEVLDAS